MLKIRNIIIFIAIAIIIVLGYIFFLKPSSPQNSLVVSSSNSAPASNSSTSNSNSGVDLNSSETSVVAKDFLTLLLNVKNIKLNDDILSNPAFNSLHDSSIVLTPDTVTGRLNPFAQFGNDNLPTPSTSTSSSAAGPSDVVPPNTPNTPPAGATSNVPTPAKP